MTMKNLLLLLPLILCGCSILQHPVPANRITIKAPQGSYDISTPKNVSITNFLATVDTNGLLRISFASWVSVNDPMVIDKATAGQVATINAWSGLLNSAVEKAAEGAAKGVKP
jgi:hypothetical protein